VYKWLYLFIISLFLINLYFKLENLVFFIRTFFLGIVGYLAYTVKLVNKDAFFSFHMQETQTLQIATLMFLFTNIALFGSEIGFLLGKKVKVKSAKKIIFENKKIYYTVLILLFIVATILSIKQPLMFFAQYATQSVHLPIQNFNTVGNILLYIVVMYYFKYQKLLNKNLSKKLLIFIVVYLLLYSELFRGARMDFLNGVIGIIILYYVYNYNTLKVNKKVLLYGVGGFILLQVIGLVRGVIAIYGLNGAVEAILRYWNSIGELNRAGVLFNQGTVNNIAATFSGTIYMIKNHIVDYYYGISYLEYIPRIPPQFLYPDRPKSLAWIFKEHGLSSGGGFFELAEAYLNFGILGIFIVPLIISFIIAYAYKKFYYNRYSLKNSILFFSIIAVFMRGTLYQTFTFFKGVITGYILYLIIYIIYGLFNAKYKEIGK
jgi:oligosaccharide repeat unit polymerase